MPAGLSTLWDAFSHEKIVDENLFRGVEFKLY